MSDPVSMTFASPPSPWLAYPKMLLSQRPTLVPQGREVPLIEARMSGLRARRQHLADYRRVCGFAADGNLPLTFPHVLTAPLHMAILTHDAFPVRLLGLVHVRNEITSHRPLGEDEALDAYCRLQGHRDTERGQEFDLVIDLSAANTVVWSETSTFLARQRSPRGSGDGAKPAARRATAALARPQGRGARPTTHPARCRPRAGTPTPTSAGAMPWSQAISTSFT